MAEVFVDTNVLLYALGDDEAKRRQANAVLLGDDDWLVSTQVLIEYVAVCLRKRLLPIEQVRASVEGLEHSAARVLLVDEAAIAQALRLHERYRYSWWDSLILAAALEARCTVLYSEDMQHGQEVEGLRIENPFTTTA